MKRACSELWAKERSCELLISGSSSGCPLRITRATGCSPSAASGKRSRRSSRARARCSSCDATAALWIDPSSSARSITHKSASSGTVSRAIWPIVGGSSSDVASTAPASTRRSMAAPRTSAPLLIAAPSDPGVASSDYRAPVALTRSDEYRITAAHRRRVVASVRRDGHARLICAPPGSHPAGQRAIARRHERSKMRIGYFLSSEEFGPRELVRQARMAEEAGFEGLWISDHFHPWNDEQGHSSFVWSTIGAIAQATEMHVTTAVTCPTVRIHPAIVAHAAATSAVLLEGRFALGLGSGEALNEHILGDRWPEAEQRLQMLEEAVLVIRRMWEGGMQSHRGRHYQVEKARIYDLPDRPPPVIISGFGPKATKLAARIGDGFCTVSPVKDAVESFRRDGGAGKGVAGGIKAG